MSYIELHARSAFSFLRGASLPEELAKAAGQLQMPAIALCDRDGLYGAPRFFAAAREHGVRPIIGSELTMEDGAVLPVLVETRTGYQNLCRLLTRAHLRAPKNESAVRWEELPEFAEGLVALTGDEEGPLAVSAVPSGLGPLPMSSPNVETLGYSQASLRDDGSEALGVSPALGTRRDACCTSSLEKLLRIFGPQHLFVEIQRHRVRGEESTVKALCQLAAHHHLPLLATNGVLYAKPPGRQVLDVFTCIRHHTHLDAAGKLLEQNSERYLRSAAEMQKVFHDLPEALANTVRLAERLQFSLENLGYQFPTYPAPLTMDSLLREQTFAGARQRYEELTPKVTAQLEH